MQRSCLAAVNMVVTPGAYVVICNQGSGVLSAAEQSSITATVDCVDVPSESSNALSPTHQ